jgi:hypothetical protein
MKDEAVAQEAQQASAGDSHTPLAGPLPYSAANLDDAIRWAVHAERERCANIAAAWSLDQRLREAWPHLTQPQLDLARDVAQAVSAQIRQPVID